MTLPLVSVIVPTFNRADLLPQCLASALNQTHANLEVIVVDDGSTDATADVVTSFQNRDSRIKFYQQENAGVAVARNAGMQRANGEFLAFLDSDDLWEPWKISLQLACLSAAPDAGMIWTNMDAVDPEGQPVQARYLQSMYSNYERFGFEVLFTESAFLKDVAGTSVDRGLVKERKLYWGDIFAPMFLGNLVHTSTVLLRRDRFENVSRFNETMRFAGEDYDFHLRTCQFGKVAYADVSSIKYRVGVSGQITESTNQFYFAAAYLESITTAYQSACERLQPHQGLIQQAFAEAHAWLGEEFLDRGQRDEARQHLLRSLRYLPTQPRTMIVLTSALCSHNVDRGLRAVYQMIKLAGRRLRPSNGTPKSTKRPQELSELAGN